jgi:hypothetical protein
VGEEKPPGLLLCSHDRASFMRGGLIRRQVGDHSAEAVFGGHLGRDPASGGSLWLPETLGGERLGQGRRSAPSPQLKFSERARILPRMLPQGALTFVRRVRRSSAGAQTQTRAARLTAAFATPATGPA